MRSAYGKTRQPPELIEMDRKKRIVSLIETLESRIMLLDGAMGTMIQGYGLSEEDYRGDKFGDRRGRAVGIGPAAGQETWCRRRRHIER